MARLRSAFDRLTKDLFQVVLADACRSLQTEREVPGEVLRADLTCELGSPFALRFCAQDLQLER